MQCLKKLQGISEAGEKIFQLSWFVKYDLRIIKFSKKVHTSTRLKISTLFLERDFHWKKKNMQMKSTEATVQRRSYEMVFWKYPCWSRISIKLLYNFIEITFPHGRCPVNLLHIFRKPFLKNTYGRLLLNQYLQSWILNKILRPRFEINLNLRQLYTTNKRWQNFNKFKLSVFLLLDWTTWMWLT